MFESTVRAERVVDADAVRAFAEVLASGVGPADDAGRIELIRAIEELKCAGEARQAQETVAFDASQRAEQAAAGVRPERQGRGVANQVALARRVSPHRGQRLLGLAKVLGAEMPHTLAAFRAGRISEWRATILVRETAMLEREERAVVDEQLAGDAGRLEGWGIGSSRVPRPAWPRGSTPPRSRGGAGGPRRSAASRSGPRPTP